MSNQKKIENKHQNSGSVNSRLRVQSKYRLGYLGTLQGQVDLVKTKLREIISEMKSDSDLEKTVRDHSSECLAEIQEVSYLIATLRTDGPAKALIMVTRHGEAIDILSGKVIDQNEAFNLLLDNIKN